MPGFVRKSRADRRRDSGALAPATERRSPVPALVPVVRSVVRKDRLNLYLQTELVAENCASSKAVLLQHCARSKRKVVIIDLEQCSYIDTAGLSVLIEIRKAVEQQGAVLVLENPSRGVLRLLNLTRMNRFFELRFTSKDQQRISGTKIKIAPTNLSEGDS